MRRLLLLATGSVVGLVAVAALAADEAPVLRQRAEQLAAEDRCDEALPRARRARELDPRDARAALVEGRCLLHQGLYRDAIAPLSDARELDPSLSGVSTDLAEAHYHLDEIDAASADLDRAERENPNDARMFLYRGLVQLKQANEKDAAASFERAGELDPGLTEVAGLYAGRSWAVAHDREKAAASLERARNADPNSEWGRAAAAELQVLNAPYRRHVWAQVEGGIMHDSNVELRQHSGVDPITLSLIGDTSVNERQDTVGVFSGQLGTEFLRDPDQSLGAVAGYDGNAHDNVHRFDLQYPWLTFWYDRRLSENTWARIQPFGGYAWLEGDPFVAHGGATASLWHAFSERLGGQVFVRANGNNYMYRIQPDPTLQFFNPALNEQVRNDRDRDGVQIDAGLEGTYVLIPNWTTLTLGTAYERYEADGQDWDRNGSRTWLSWVQGLPLDFVLEVTGAFSYQPYDNPSSYDFPGFFFGTASDRNDKIAEVNGELRYPITDWLEVSARGAYIDNESNVRDFDYDRWLAGGFVKITWNDTWGS